MALAPRVWSRFVRFGLLLSTFAVFLSIPLAAPAAAQGDLEGVKQEADPAARSDEPGCAVTGYLVPADEDLTALREELRAEDSRRLTGVDLTRGADWVLPDGGRPVLVVDSTEPLEQARITMAAAGQEFTLATTDLAAGQRRYVSGVLLPHLGPTTRTIGLGVSAGACAVESVVSVDRSVWSTRVGQVAIVLTALCGGLLVVVARRRPGGWVRRFLLALPFGLLAGAAQVAVWHEAGRVDPFGAPPWWPPVVGLAMAALLPLTRPRRRGRAAPVPGPVGDLPTLPLGTVVAGYRLTTPVARTQLAGVFRAERVSAVPAQAAGGPDAAPAPEAERRPPQALVKVALPERAGEPWARLRLEREAAVLTGLVHPNVIRLREAVAGEDGPPVLVFDDIEGGSLRALLTSGGTLSGPQAVTVVLEVLAALADVHGRGMVHRDVRPETIFLDAAGRVRLTNFELACVGMEHPAAVEGTPPYASPEQVAGQVLDERSDLWACGMLLGELLTGQAPEPTRRLELPAPLAEVVAGALAPDLAARPASAEQFAAHLREAAAAVWGPDWAGRAALAGVVVAHGAIGSMAAGYTAAGALGVTATGAMGSAGTGGFGAAGAAGGGATGFGASGGVVAAGQVAAAAGQGALAGKVSFSISAALAAVVVVGVGVTVAVVDPEPARARSEVITPDRARVIFVETVTEAQRGVDDHLTERAWDLFERMPGSGDGETPPTHVVVGVPGRQYAYPAWFVGSAHLVGGAETVSIFARFERQAADEPWLMTDLNWAVDAELAPPALDDEGWLLPVPDLVVEPATLPDQYVEWLHRVEASGELGEDELLVLSERSGTLSRFAEDQIFSGDLDEVSFDYEIVGGQVATDPVPLSDGTVHVSFTVIIHQVMYNTPDGRSAGCTDYHLFWSNRQPPGLFRHIEHDFVITVDAWVPTTAAEVDPAGAMVVVEDWKRRSENREGTPC